MRPIGRKTSILPSVTVPPKILLTTQRRAFLPTHQGQSCLTAADCSLSGHKRKADLRRRFAKGHRTASRQPYRVCSTRSVRQRQARGFPTESALAPWRRISTAVRRHRQAQSWPTAAEDRAKTLFCRPGHRIEIGDGAGKGKSRPANPHHRRQNLDPAAGKVIG